MTSQLLEETTPDLPDLDQSNWIEEDVVFDLMFEICDALYENDFRETSFQLELGLDAFLLETRRALPVTKDEMRHSKRSALKRARNIPARLKAGATRTRFNTKRAASMRRAEHEDQEIDNIFAGLWDASAP